MTKKLMDILLDADNPERDNLRNMISIGVMSEPEDEDIKSYLRKYEPQTK